MNQKIDTLKKYLQEKKLDYFDFRLEENKKNSISIENKKVNSVNENENFGCGVRVIKNSKLGFCYFSNLDKYKETIDKCIEDTKYSKKIKFDNYAENKGKDIIKHKRFEDKEIETKAKELLSINKKHLSKKEYIVLFSNISYQETITKKYFINENSFIVQEVPRIHVFIKITGKTNNNIESSFERVAIVGGLEKISLEKIETAIVKAHKKLKEKIFAEKCPAKKTNIIITPDLADLLAHEAIGHASEGDLISSNSSVLKKGLKLTNNKQINIVDNPLLKKFGYFKYDDEGIKSQEKKIVKDGVVNDFLLDVLSATKLSLISNGSARAETYRNLPIPRMSNTYFLAGKDKYKDMLKEFSGLLIDGFRGGQVDPAVGTFMFGIDRAYLIEKGNIKKTYKQASISGNIKTYLNNITQIANKIGEFSHGYCGKDGQTAFVSGSGPYMKIDNVVVGGTKHE